MGPECTCTWYTGICQGCNSPAAKNRRAAAGRVSAGPRVSLNCGTFNSCEACKISWCECQCHGKLPLEVPRADGQR